MEPYAGPPRRTSGVAADEVEMPKGKVFQIDEDEELPEGRKRFNIEED